MKRALEMESYEEEGVFKTQCKCHGKVCKMAITEAAFSNFVSLEVIEKLGIESFALRKPYIVQGWNGEDTIDITEQAYIHFGIGPYEDNLWFDIVPKMECHFVLGRTWIREKGAWFDKPTNTYNFEKDEGMIRMTSLQKEKAQWLVAKYVKEMEWIGFVDPREKENEKENKMGKSLEERIEEEKTMVAKERDVGKEFSLKKRGNRFARKGKGENLLTKSLWDEQEGEKNESSKVELRDEVFDVEGQVKDKDDAKDSKKEEDIMTVNGVILRQHMQEVSKVMSGQR